MRPAIKDRLIEALSDESEEIVLAAIFALGEAGRSSPSITDRLLKLTLSKSHDIKLASIKALGRASIVRYKD